MSEKTLLLSQQPKGRVLDVGCGHAGRSIELARRNNCEFYCLDLDRAALIQARRTARDCQVEKKLEFLLADVTQLNFPSTCFDLIIFKASLHHLLSWKAILSRARDWLKSGGTIYLEEPLRTNPIGNLAVYLYYSVGSSFLFVHERPESEWPFDPKDLLREVRKHFKICHVSYHYFLRHLFEKAANFAQHSMVVKIFRELAKKAHRLDHYVEAHPILQKYCTVIIIQGTKEGE